jgi:glycosyltransferase involved in cell wall biosynthesis
MRITCVLGPYLPVPPLRGGAVERIWQNLCAEFARLGHDVTLISRRFGNLPNEEIRDGVRYIRVRSIDAPHSKLLYRLFDIAYATAISAILPTSDVTITNTISLPLLIPHQRAGKIYVSVARFPKGQMAFYRRADRLQAVSNAVADAITRQSPSVSARVKVVPNALSATFARLRELSRGPRKNEILYVGRIAREKGLDLLVRAFQLIAQRRSDWCLSILGPWEENAGGDGLGYYQNLQCLAVGSRGLIKFEAPMYDEIALVKRMQEASVFVYPSVAEQGEALPMAPLEAMSCGCAIVVSNFDCFRDYLRDCQNGIIFDHRDASGAALMSALERLMDAPRLCHDLGTAAIHMSKKFDVDRVAQLFVADFAELTGDGRLDQ